MAAVLDDSQLVPLLETLEDSSTSHTEKTDAYLSIANRLSGEDGKAFSALVGKQFPRLYKAFKIHIAHQHSDLNNAALQTLGFCVFNSTIVSGISASEMQELLSTLNSIAVKAGDKNSCTRALWVISKQNFSPEEVGKVVPSILSTLENVLNKDVQSVVIAYEALNVIIRLLEQTPAQMTTEAVRWAKLVLPLVVHAAGKVRIRAATVLEIGVPLLQKQPEVSALTEQLMTSKIIGELHKLFTSKNETYVLKLWPLFVKLLGKTLHRSGSFINSLLQLEELGFRSGTPAVKKIAFIAWKSLIDNFASNPDILCSSKRLKLLMQPLSSIHVRTEILALTKVEVWWYLLKRLGSQLSVHFEQVCLPLIQSALSVEPSQTPSRAANQSLMVSTPLQKGSFPFSSPATPKINLNSSLLATVAFPSVHLLGIEMMLHFLLGPDVVEFAARHKLVLSLEPLQHRLISSSSFFSKHANTLLGAVQDGFITIGKDAPGAVLHAVWKDMIEFVKVAMETGNKKERQGSEVLTCLLEALKNVIVSDALQVEKCLSLLECTLKGLPQKVLASAAYQVANMDLLNGTPALFLIQLHFHPGLLEHGVMEERFFMNYETLVSYVFSGPTSPLAFSESVLQELNQGAKLLENKELLWRMWSILINPLTERVNQTNEVNQGDALEHNFSALHNALMLPINHIFPVAEIPQPTIKTLMRSWSDLYKTFSRCAALVTTTDENVCCEELCSRILGGLGDQTLGLPLVERLVQVITVIVECVNFSPYSTKFQPKTKAPHTPTDWAKKKKGPLGNLHSVLVLLEKLIEGFHALCSDQSLIETSSSTLTAIGSSIISCLSTCISHISLPSVLRTVFSSLTNSVSVFYAKTKSESPKVYSGLYSKLDKLLADMLSCLGSRYTGSYDNELLEVLSPLLCAIFLHKSKTFRNQVTQFWNGSFARAAVLVYPEEMKPVLSQVKMKTPILLPGFTYSNSVEESSGAYSDHPDSSELATKVSGIEVKSGGKRDSLLPKAEELKGTPTKAAQARAKLDFNSPNTKKKLLEEERSVDFVFIPPETKERLLTEHQKEVLRTKRVDIPTMYNNLDASQDTAMFTQYTQSQENSLEKPEVLEMSKEAASEAKVKTEEMKRSEAATKEEKTASKVIDVEMLEDNADDAKTPNNLSVFNTSNDCQNTATDAENTSNISNGSASSDMVLGTPPPPASRRQSFITLEKFDGPESRSFSPLADKMFKSKEVILVPDSQEAVNITENDSENLDKNEEKLSQTQATKQNHNDVSKSASKRETRASRGAELSESQISVSEVNQEESVSKREKRASRVVELSESKISVSEVNQDESASKREKRVSRGAELSESKNFVSEVNQEESASKREKKASRGAELSESKISVSEVNQEESASKREKRASRKAELSESKISVSEVNQESVSKREKASRGAELSESKISVSEVNQEESASKREKRASRKAELSESKISVSGVNREESVSKREKRASRVVELSESKISVSEVNQDESASKRETRASSGAELSESKISVSEVNQEESVSDKMEDSDIVPDTQPSQVDEQTEVLDKGKTVAVSKVDTKENTPPDTDDKVRNKANPQKTLTNQLSLRRSSRRQSEILDAVKNENESEKRIQTKEEPRTVSKKSLPTREAAKRQESETPIKSEGENQNISRKPEDEIENKEELPDSNSSKDSQEKPAARSNYKTRRSLQAVVSTTDNSESDNSETLEGSVQKRRRGRPRSSDNRESSKQSKTDVELSSKHPEDSANSREVEKANSEIDNKTYSMVTDSSTLHSKLEPDEHTQRDSKLDATERNKTYDVTKNSTVSSAMVSLMTEPSAGDFSTVVSDVFQSDNSSPDCPHKRSKRIRRSRNCDCCGGLATKGLKSEGKNHKMQMSSTIQLNDTTFSGPCAISTPLANEQMFFNSAREIKSDTESEQEQTIVPLSKSETYEITETSSEMATDETVVAGSPKEVKSDSVVLVKESVGKDGEIDEAMEDGEGKKETTGYKTFDLEANGVPASSLVDGKPEKDLDNAENLMVDEECAKEVKNTETEAVLSGNVDVEIVEVDAKVAEDVEIVENVEDKTIIPADETSAVNMEEEMDFHEMNAQTEEHAQTVFEEPAQTISEEPAQMAFEEPAQIAFEEHAETVSMDHAQAVSEEHAQTASDAHAVSEDHDQALSEDHVQAASEEHAQTASEEHAQTAFDEHAQTASEEHAQTAFDEQNSVAAVLPGGEKGDENLCTATEQSEAPKMDENMVFEYLGDGRASIDSPPKVKGLTSMAIVNDSPSGSFCWSPSASPSTSILKKGLKRQQEIDSPSPVNKIRRVSFADPIYQEGLADDIDRRSPVIRNSSSPSSRSLKMLTNNQQKIITTPTKGFVSPGARALGFKSSKKSLISEMTKESMPSPKESVYPALMNCTTSIDVILPQITSNMWARGLGQLIRAKNIKTIGDLSTMTPCEIKTLPIRSPKISTVKKALRVYHEQQTKVKGYDEFAVLDEAEKPLNGVDEKSGSADEDKIETDLPEASATASSIEESTTPDILTQINALSLLFTPEELGKYSGSQLFEMQEKLGMISNCVLRQLQSRWRSPPHDGSV